MYQQPLETCRTNVGNQGQLLRTMPYSYTQFYMQLGNICRLSCGCHCPFWYYRFPRRLHQLLRPRCKRTAPGPIMDHKQAASASQIALYPLSALDVLFERTTFVTGWLVEGTIDSEALASALTRLTEKWRMLAGRLVSQKTAEVSSFLVANRSNHSMRNAPFSFTRTENRVVLAYTPWTPSILRRIPNFFTDDDNFGAPYNGLHTDSIHLTFTILSPEYISPPIYAEAVLRMGGHKPPVDMLASDVFPSG